MIKIGFVSAILADQTFEEVISFAAESGYSCVEIMCWPTGKAERRYAGVTHIDVTNLSKEKVDSIQSLLKEKGVSISGLGYYPNPLEADNKNAAAYIEHIKKVINAANQLGLENVNTFIGRDHQRNLEDNFVAPRNPVERALVDIWAEVLELEQVSIHDNFFDLGGHSLLAIRLIDQIQQQFGKRIPLTILFQAPAIAQLARFIDQHHRC